MVVDYCERIKPDSTLIAVRINKTQLTNERVIITAIFLEFDMLMKRIDYRNLSRVHNRFTNSSHSSLKNWYAISNNRIEAKTAATAL